MSFMKIAAAVAALCFVSAGARAETAKLTDPQIAHIAYTAGLLDIEAAKLALKQTKNKVVITFANDMIEDHTAVNNKALALLKKLKVTPENNATSKSLTTDAKTKRETLAKLTGAEFDRAYAENEVAYHKTVNGALEGTLIPATTNAELKSLLQTGLEIFKGHEQHAETLAKTLTTQHSSL